MLRARCSRLAYFSLHHLIGSRLSEHYREFRDLQKASVQRLREVQAGRLESLLSHAATQVPFYRERVAPAPSLELRSFPVLSKQDIRQNFQKLMSPDLLREHNSAQRKFTYSWLPVQTGGSTGMPTTVIHDRDFRDLSRAARLYTQYLCGFPLGTPYFKLWGSMREISDAKGSLQQQLAGRLAGEVILNAFRMEESEMDAYVQAINNTSIAHMMAYSDAAFRMAEHILDKGRSVRRLKSIMACAGTLTEEMRRSISKAFGGARVHNMYGSRDCGAMACECGHGSLHIFDNKVILETVDQNGSAVPAGQAGRILVTLLGNYGFPLIRYDIGDVGALSGKLCDCGLPMQLLDRVEGRGIEFFVTAKGGYISPIYFRHLIGVVHNPGVIRRFQIIQYAQDRVALALEKEPGALESVIGRAIEGIRRDLMAVFGAETSLQIDLVSHIPESDSGKFIFAINKTGQLGAP